MAENKTEKLDSSSPYYIGPQDRPGEKITDVRLRLDNYDDWAHSIRHALRARRKYGFVDGTYTEPKPPCTTEDWDTLHSMLVSWLMLTIDSKVRSLLPRYDNAKKLWDDLAQQFGAVDALRVYQVKSSLYECRQTESMAVAVYYAKLCQLWDQLDKLEPLIACTCKKCDCKVDEQNLARRESDRLNQFLYGLIPARYRSLRSVLLTKKPLPSVYRAFQLMSQEDRSGTVDSAHPSTLPQSTELGSFAVRSKNRPISRPSSMLSRMERQKLVCTHCNRKGHDRSMCFDLLGELPDWWYELGGISKPARGGTARGGADPVWVVVVAAVGLPFAVRIIMSLWLPRVRVSAQ